MGPRVQHCTRQALRCLCGLVLSINTGLAVCPPGHTIMTMMMVMVAMIMKTYTDRDGDDSNHDNEHDSDGNDDNDYDHDDRSGDYMM